MPRAILDGDPYPVRGLIVSGASILTAWPDPERWRRARCARPARRAQPLPDSRRGVRRSAAAGHDDVRDRVLRRGGRARRASPTRDRAPRRGAQRLPVFAELAERLGYGERWPLTEREIVEHALAGTGITYEELVASSGGIELPRRRGASAVRTASARRRATGLRDPNRPLRDRVRMAARSRRTTRCPSTPSRPRGRLRRPSSRSGFRSSSARAHAPVRLSLAAPQHRSLVALQPWPLVHLHTEDAAAAASSPATRSERRHATRPGALPRGRRRRHRPRGRRGEHGRQAGRSARRPGTAGERQRADRRRERRPRSRGSPCSRRLLCDVERVLALAARTGRGSGRHGSSPEPPGRAVACERCAGRSAPRTPATAARAARSAGAGCRGGRVPRRPTPTEEIRMTTMETERAAQSRNRSHAGACSSP